ncbi:MAG: hypothetical protein M5U09_30495, partial [Gammaproteobacteria bacterium]|nr:hypothetical protein [Gammaproteobacteria bacterium]
MNHLRRPGLSYRLPSHSQLEDPRRTSTSPVLNSVLVLYLIEIDVVVARHGRGIDRRQPSTRGPEPP